MSYASFLEDLSVVEGSLGYDFAADSSIECGDSGLIYTGIVEPDLGIACSSPTYPAECSPIQYLIDECTAYGPPTPCGLTYPNTDESFDAGGWSPVTTVDGDSGDFLTPPFTRSITNPSEDYEACFNINVGRSVLVRIVGISGSVTIQDTIDGEGSGCEEQFSIAYDDENIAGLTHYRPYNEYCLTGTLAPGETRSFSLQVRISGGAYEPAPEEGSESDAVVEWSFITYRFGGNLFAMDPCCDCPGDETTACADPDTAP